MDNETGGYDMKDACYHEIVPSAQKLSIHTNRHTDTQGYSFGWIEGCEGNVIWSNGTKFNYDAARKFVNEYNAQQEA